MTWFQKASGSVGVGYSRVAFRLFGYSGRSVEGGCFCSREGITKLKKKKCKKREIFFSSNILLCFLLRDNGYSLMVVMVMLVLVVVKAAAAEAVANKHFSTIHLGYYKVFGINKKWR